MTMSSRAPLRGHPGTDASPRYPVRTEFPVEAEEHYAGRVRKAGTNGFEKNPLPGDFQHLAFAKGSAKMLKSLGRPFPFGYGCSGLKEQNLWLFVHMQWHWEKTVIIRCRQSMFQFKVISKDLEASKRRA